MEDFPFLLNLNYKMELFTIKPVKNLSTLKEIATEKFDLKVADMIYINEEGEENPLESEWDYVNLIEYATQEHVSDIEIIIRKEDKTSKKRKESQRKKSSMKNEYDGTSIRKKKTSTLDDVKEFDEYEKNNNIGTNNMEENDSNEDIGIQCDYDYFGDTRNRKGMIEEGYTNQNKGYKEQKRIYYIKEKRELQREEDLKRNKENESNDEDEEEEEKKKSKKRALKKTNDNDENYGNNCSEPNEKKNNKKKKKPKKDRVRY